jgi:hypothetical protein
VFDFLVICYHQTMFSFHFPWNLKENISNTPWKVLFYYLKTPKFNYSLNLTFKTSTNPVLRYIRILGNGHLTRYNYK